MTDAKPTAVSLWEKPNGWITWVALGRLRDSFLSKAIAAISLAALVLGNIGQVLRDVGLDPTSAKVTFAGGVSFLLGYLGFTLSAPSEFRKGGDVLEIVGRLKDLSYFKLFESRRNRAIKLDNDVKSGKIFGLPEGPRMFLRQQVSAAGPLTDADWEKGAVGLYQADITLRQYTRPWARIFVGLMFAFGIVLLAWPTLVNILNMART